MFVLVGFFFDEQALHVWQPVSWKSRAFSASWEVKPRGQAVDVIMQGLICGVVGGQDVCEMVKREGCEDGYTVICNIER